MLNKEHTDKILIEFESHIDAAMDLLYDKKIFKSVQKAGKETIRKATPHMVDSGDHLKDALASCEAYFEAAINDG